MNFHQLKLYCAVCPDRKHAESNLHTVQCITKNAKQYITGDIKKLDNRDSLCGYVFNSHINNHFMCGQCLDFNNSIFNNAENELKEVAYSLICQVRENYVPEIYHEIYRLFQGYYPLICKALELAKS